MLGADDAGEVHSGGGEDRVGDAVDEPWQPARALEQRPDDGRTEEQSADGNATPPPAQNVVESWRVKYAPWTV